MSYPERATRLFGSLHKLCDKIRAEELFTPGQVRFYSRLAALKTSKEKCIADVQSLLDELQVRKAGSHSSSSVEDTVQAIRQRVSDATEKIDLELDRHREIVQPVSNPLQVNVTAAHTADVAKSHEPAMLRKSSFGSRPQDAFDPPVDNSNTHKMPDYSHLLGIASDLNGSDDDAALTASGVHECSRRCPDSGQCLPRHNHPFATALDRLPGMYPPWMLEMPAPQLPAPLDKSGFDFIDSTSSLAELAEALSSVREFAVDLEHSDRSFLGFTCLIQISTRAKDYVVDTLALRNHLGAALAAPFANEQILKVLHGADRDIEWLQKDFGLFVVNMFDTGKAARILNLPCGLGKLLNQLCHADKSLQTADWRKRPLTKSMLTYARMDTHYLLYMADLLRVKLLKAQDKAPEKMKVQMPVQGPQGALGLCLELSRRMTTKLYERPLLTPDSFMKFYNRSSWRLERDQLSVLAALFSWRDTTCRRLDESPGHLLPKRLMGTLSSLMPQDAPGVLRILGRHKMLIPYAQEVADVIIEGLKNPISNEQAAMCSPSKARQSEQGATSSPTGSDDEPESLLAQDVSDGTGRAHSESDAAVALELVQRDRNAFSLEGRTAGLPEVSIAPDIDSPDLGRISSAPVHPPELRTPGATHTSKIETSSNGVAFIDSGVEAVSFASLPMRRVTMAAGRQTAAGASEIEQIASSSGGGRKIAAPPDGMQRTEVCLDATPAQSTMAKMFAEPIQRRKITVQKLHSSVSALGSMLTGCGEATGTGAMVAAATDPASVGAGVTEIHALSVENTENARSRDKRAEVAAAAAALREDADAAGEGHVASARDADAAGDAEGDLLSVRERYGHKRKASAPLLGDLTTVPLSKHEGAKMMRLRNQGDRHIGGRGGKKQFPEQDVQMFDYEVVLDGSDRLPSRHDSGRGRKGSRVCHGRDPSRQGRQGRRQMRGDEHKSSKRAGIFEGRKGQAWNPYAVEAAETLGKRSGSSAPKSGNKSGTFRG